MDVFVFAPDVHTLVAGMIPTFAAKERRDRRENNFSDGHPGSRFQPSGKTIRNGQLNRAFDLCALCVLSRLVLLDFLA